MPRTFRDAILLVRFLGYRYLWIDSLCILQDQLEDWEAEAKKMGEIYRNARFTIVAAAATSADSGCFQDVDVAPLRDRLPCMVGTLEVQESCSTHDSHHINIFANVARQKTSDHLHTRFKPLSALDSRGWVLQEEVLSARALILAEDGVYWECMGLVASEEFPNGICGMQTRSVSPNMDVDAYYPVRASYAAEFKKLLLQILNPSQEPESTGVSKAAEIPDLESTSRRMFASLSGLDGQFANNWKKIAENYSSRHLTNESDRIVAIRGLATLIEQARGDKFHAGLWRDFMGQHLLWHMFPTIWVAEHACGCLSSEGTRWIPGHVTPRIPHKPAVAPSWSWASVNQKVIFTGADEILEYFVRIVDIETTEGRTGVTGRLKIQGILRPVVAIRERFLDEYSEG
ncbi:hypothetical protein RRF57_004744 [Xylaria bambusicola]|uniref:Heterokaryon incompatibility domain-containing protein n=1 Tax=Xylaria bambusicola TaxID=326684 RepID=A0AAN7UWV3_9PEZI